MTAQPRSATCSSGREGRPERPCWPAPPIVRRTTTARCGGSASRRSRSGSSRRTGTMVEHLEPFAHRRTAGGAAAAPPQYEPRTDDVIAGLETGDALPERLDNRRPSWPSTIGIAWRWIPWTEWWSERHTPDAAIRIWTSPAFGGSSSSSSRRRSSTSHRTAARMREVSRTGSGSTPLRPTLRPSPSGCRARCARPS